VLGERRLLAREQQVGHRALQAEQRAPRALGGVGGEHRRTSSASTARATSSAVCPCARSRRIAHRADAGCGSADSAR
jgi:hypothetical protein